MPGEADAFLLLVIAFIFPPLAVAFVAGCGVDLCLNILLTMLGWFPGCIHAFWIVLRRAEANERYGYRNWTYSGMGEYHPYGQPGGPPPPPPGQQPPPSAQQPPPPTQQPVDQKQGGYTQPAAAPAGAYQAPQQAPVDQKQGGDLPPPPPAVQKYTYQALPQQPADQKQADSSASGNATTGGT